MSSREARFIERTAPTASGSVVPLNRMESFLSKIPAEIDFVEALLYAGVDANYVIKKAQPAVERAEKNGVLKTLNLTKEEALIIASYTVEGCAGSLSMYDALNRTLRETRDEVSMIRIRMLLVLFLRTLRKLPLVEKTDVYRGIAVNLGPVLKCNSIVTWWGFTSVTWNANTTNTFVGSTGGSLFILKGSCHGYDSSVLSVFPDECELLLEPETRIETTAVIKLGPTASLVQCSIVSSDVVLEGLAPRVKTEVDEMYSLAQRYKKGDGVPQDFKKAAELFQRASDKGDARAMFSLAFCYKNGQGVPKDSLKTAELFQRASDKGHAAASSYLGVCYFNGMGVPRDVKKAVELYQRAVDKDDKDAMYYLGYCYKNGHGVPQDLKKAVELYQRSVDKGNVSALTCLGLCYYNGQGVPQDFKKAVELYQRAMDKGDRDAMHNLGLCFYNGQGVPQDYKKAAELYQRAIDKGHVAAITALGVCYSNGKGVPKNKEKAIELWQRASKMGDQYAKTLLAKNSNK